MNRDREALYKVKLRNHNINELPTEFTAKLINVGVLFQFELEDGQYIFINHEQIKWAVPINRNKYESKEVDSRIRNAEVEAYRGFASALISEIIIQWGDGPQDYVNSNDKFESLLAQRDVETIEMIERLSKVLQEEV